MERAKLIDAIVKFSGEEIAEFSKSEFIDLAKESNDELLDRLIEILKWYDNEVKELIEENELLNNG
jgi:Zn-finger protein